MEKVSHSPGISPQHDSILSPNSQKNKRENVFDRKPKNNLNLIKRKIYISENIKRELSSSSSVSSMSSEIAPPSISSISEEEISETLEMESDIQEIIYQGERAEKKMPPIQIYHPSRMTYPLEKKCSEEFQETKNGSNANGRSSEPIEIKLKKQNGGNRQIRRRDIHGKAF